MKLDKSAPGFVIIKPNHDFDNSSPFRLAPALSKNQGPDLVWIQWDQLDYFSPTSWRTRSVHRSGRQGPAKRKTPLLDNPRLFFFEDGTKRSILVGSPAGLNPTDRFHYRLNALISQWHSKATERGVDHPKPYATVRYPDFFAEILSF